MAKTKRKIILQESHVKALRYIQKYIKNRVVAPRMTDIASGVSLTLRQTYRVVNDLVELGYISRIAYRNRSIRVEKDL